MTIKNNIESILKGQLIESSCVEYKEGFNPSEIIHSITAFANDIDNVNGGIIIIGVKEKNGLPVLPVKGLKPDSVDGIQKKLLQYCHYIFPFYVPKSEVVNYKDKILLVLKVIPGYNRPYRCRKDVTDTNAPLHYYIRKFSSTVQANSEQIQELYESASRVPFDDQMNPFASLKDIDRGLMIDHLKKVGSNSLKKITEDTPTKDIADDLELVDDLTGEVYPKNIALLMFSKNPLKFFPYAFIEVVNLPDATGINIKEKKFVGPLQKQLNDALDFLERTIIVDQYQKMENEIHTKHNHNYPIEAIREFLANAVYHRSYQIRESITVTILPNAIEIKSFPGLDPSIKDQDIKNLVIRSKRPYRNRRIGNFLKELHLTEGRNTGIPLALKALRENGSPDPVFETDEERQGLIVRILIEPSFWKKNSLSSTVVEDNKNLDKVSDEELKRMIWSLLSKEDLSLRELCKKLGYKFVSKRVSNILDQLVSNKTVKILKKGRWSKIKVIRSRF